MKKKFILIHIFSAMSYLAAAQNVGIGTNTPGERLEVIGNIKADTIKPNAVKLILNAGAGKVLTSDAAGNANWQTNTVAAGNSGFGVWGDCATNGNISAYNPVVDTSGSVGDGLGQVVETTCSDLQFRYPVTMP